MDQSFWVNVIGRGYMPPSNNFRWCTDRLKISPTDTLLSNLVIKNKQAILLIGSRRSESINRKKTMEKHKVKADKLNDHTNIDSCKVFSPLADLTDNDVWIILQQRKPPWGGTHRNLITLYKNAGGGECPLVLSKDDAPSCGSSSPRFGCWTCTVVNKDRSMKGSIDAGHKDEDKLEALYDFREWLIELRSNLDNRSYVRRNGSIIINDEGKQKQGPFKLEVRKEILNQLKELENEIGEQLITQTELEFIYETWRRDEIQEESRVSMLSFLRQNISEENRNKIRSIKS